MKKIHVEMFCQKNNGISDCSVRVFGLVFLVFLFAQHFTMVLLQGFPFAQHDFYLHQVRFPFDSTKYSLNRSTLTLCAGSSFLLVAM